MLSKSESMITADAKARELVQRVTQCGFTSPCSPEPTRPCDLQPGHGGPHGYR